MDVDTRSYWAPLFTRFTAIDRYIPVGAYARTNRPRACVIGASDGKFALPLLHCGWQVTAVENDALFLNGGTLELADGTHETPGLRRLLAEDGLAGRCDIIEADYMTLPAARGDHDFVMGSGLWSMPPNRHHSLRDLIHRAMDMVAPGGIFFADYLLPFTPEERTQPHYPEVAEMAEIITRPGWTTFENQELGIYGESHVGYEEWHYHRYAALVAHRFRTG